MTWSNSNSLVAKVATTGLVTGVSVGTAVLVATRAGKHATATITLIPAAVASVAAGPEGFGGGDAHWTHRGGGIRRPTVAAVTASGLVTGVATGSTTITATSEGKRGSAVVSVTAPLDHHDYYASPGGASSGDGSITRPWDLATALSGGNGRVQPGDTIWLRSGTYRGMFRSTLRGTAAAPIVVRQYPGERAIVDADGATFDVFRVEGTWSIFWGFELTNSSPGRTSPTRSTHYRPDEVVSYGAHNKFINLIVHDGGVAFYTWSAWPDVEIYGCIIYNNGWQGPRNGSGHGIYTKNDIGPVLIRDNVLFNQFGYGITAYTDAGTGELNNIRIDGNVSFNNGAISAQAATAGHANLSVGGQVPARQIVVTNNMTYFSRGLGVENVVMGLTTMMNEDLAFRNNYAVGGREAISVRHWKQLTVADNIAYGTGSVMRLDTSLAGYEWRSNVYYRDPTASAWRYARTSYTFDAWRAVTGLGATDQTVSSVPETAVFVRPSLYEPGRANIIVYNWTRQPAVLVDVARVLEAGDRYAVRSVQALFGPPLASGTYTGSPISIPMRQLEPPTPVGTGWYPAPVTGPEFDVFILTRVPDLAGPRGPRRGGG